MSGAVAFTLITGASTGIGREIARLAAAEGHPLVLVARSEEALRDLASELHSAHGIRAEVLRLDLGEPGAARVLFEECLAREWDVDTLVNNAGFGSVGPFHRTPLDLQVEMLRLNVVALTELTHLFLPAMLSRGRGRILNVASTAGLQPGPLMAVYYATKAYVLSFSEAISEELRGTGVSVTALLPGPTRTEFQKRAVMEGSTLTRFGMAEARPVAEVGYRAMKKGRAVAIAGASNLALSVLVRISPRFLVRKVVKRLNRVASR